MVVSILMRKTRIQDRAEWEKRLAAVMPDINKILAAENGFVSVQYSWGLEDDGSILQTTTWQTPDDCQRFVRLGAAANIATMEDAAIPTAAFPDGSWVRKTYEVVETAS